MGMLCVQQQLFFFFSLFVVVLSRHASLVFLLDITWGKRGKTHRICQTAPVPVS